MDSIKEELHYAKVPIQGKHFNLLDSGTSFAQGSTDRKFCYNFSRNFGQKTIFIRCCFD